MIAMLCILQTGTAFAQNFLQERRIYIVDVTASMEGKGAVKTPDIFSKVKQELVGAVNSISDPNTEVVIVPFTNVPHEPIKGVISNKDSLITDIQNLSIKKGDTNVADAWSRGVQEIDSSRVNYVFLLTDGLHNCGPEKNVLYERLRDWETLSANNYYFAFYVMLTPNAKEQEICQIADSTSQMWLIESMNVNVTFVGSSLNVQTNIKDKKTVRLPLRLSNKAILKDGLDFTMELEKNPYYRMENFRPYLDKGYVLFDVVELKPLRELPIEVWTKLHILYDKEKYYMTFFTPEVINFKIINRGIREMNIEERKS